MTQAGPPKPIRSRLDELSSQTCGLASLAKTCRGCDAAPRVSQYRPKGCRSPRALTARHVGVAAFPVNNRPETGKAGQRSFPTAAGWCSRLNRLSSRPTLATARGEPGPITTGGDHGSPLSRGRPDGGTSKTRVRQRRRVATRPFICSRNIPPAALISIWRPPASPRL